MDVIANLQPTDDSGIQFRFRSNVSQAFEVTPFLARWNVAQNDKVYRGTLTLDFASGQLTFVSESRKVWVGQLSQSNLDLVRSAFAEEQARIVSGAGSGSLSDLNESVPLELVSISKHLVKPPTGHKAPLAKLA